MVLSFPTAFAAQTENEIFCADLTVSAGETVSVPVQIANNTGFMGFSIKITYDSNALTPLSVAAGEVLSRGLLNDNIETAARGSFKVIWMDSQNTVADGALFTVTFKASENASGSESISLSYSQADTFDEDWNEVVFNCVSGSVSISSSEAGQAVNCVVSENSQVMAGGTFDFPVNFNETTSLMGFGIEITYDTAVFTPTAVTRGSAFVSGALNDNLETADGRLLVIWTGTENVEANGTAFTVTFEVDGNAPTSEHTIGISYVQADTFNEDWQDVELNCEDAVVSVEAFAANRIYSQSIGATAEESIDVPILIKNNSGLMGFAIKISYDANMLIPVSAAAGEVTSNGLFDNNIENAAPGSFRAVWTGSGNIAADGVLFTVTFSVRANARGSTAIGISYTQADTFDEEWKSVVLSCKGASVEIENEEYVSTPRFYSQPISAQAGGSEAVPIFVENNSSLTGFSLTITYDSECFIPVSVSCGATVSGSVESNIEAMPDGALTVTWSGEEAITQDGEIFSVLFSIRECAQGNEMMGLACDGIEFASGDDAFEVVCEEIEIFVSTPDTPIRLYSNPVLAVSGQTVELPVYISNNYGIMGLGITVSYDSSVLTPISAVRGAVLNAGTLDSSIGASTEGSYKLIWNNSENVSGSGIAFVLRFAIAPDSNCESTTVTLTGRQDDTYNEKWETVDLDTASLNIDIGRLCLFGQASSLTVGRSMQLSAFYKINGTPSGEITWSTSNPSVASVDSNGLVRALSYGGAEITAADEFGNRVSCFVEVLPVNAVISIFSYSGSFTQKLDWWKSYSTATLNLGIRKYNCEDAVEYVWSSSNSRVKVDQRGNVTNTGSFSRSATITVTAYDINGNVVAKSSVRVSFYKFAWQRRG